jgi:phage FluMu gp28-like protein
VELVIPYCPHEAQKGFHLDGHRFKVMVCGRRWGKTLAACADGLQCAIQVPKAVCWWVAPTYGMAMIGWRKLDELMPRAIVADRSLSEHSYGLVNGSRIAVKSADNPVGLRGEGLDWLGMDEAAFVKEDAWWQALRPALTDKKGRAVFISTPLGRNWFYQLYLLGQDGADPDWKAWRFRTVDNPYIDPKEIEEAKRNMTEQAYRQEYEAEFIEDAGTVFRRVSEAITAMPQQVPLEGHSYVMGVDLARINDFTVITVLDVTQEPMALVAMDRFNQISWEFQVGRIKAMVDRFHPDTVLVDQTGVGDPILEQLRRELGE